MQLTGQGPEGCWLPHKGQGLQVYPAREAWGGSALLPNTAVPVPGCRAGHDPRQLIRHRHGLIGWNLHRTLQDIATSAPPTALTTIDASDRAGNPKAPFVWPNQAKQAHNFYTHLPDAMDLYKRHKRGWAW